MFQGSDLRRAAVFHAVARAGGIAAAARAIGKSAPAVHYDLRRFERDIGVSLMERWGRSLRLTPQGRLLFETIGRALDEIGQVRAHLHRTDLGQLPLRIGTVTGFGRYRLAPRLFTALARERPLLFRVGSHDEMLAALSSGQVDLALTYRAVTAVPIESIAVAEESLVLVGGQGTVQMADVERLRFVTYEEHEYVFARWFAAVHGRQPVALDRHDQCTELEEALASVAAGRGATIAPVDACLAMGLEPAAEHCLNTIYLCGTRATLSSPEAELIRSCVGGRP